MIVARDYKAGVTSGSMVASCKGGQGVLGGFARIGRSCQRTALVARIVTAHKLSCLLQRGFIGQGLGTYTIALGGTCCV